MEKDPVFEKTLDATTGKAIATDPASSKTMVDDDTQNDVASAPAISIDPVTGKTVIVDPVTGSVVDEITVAPVASLDSSVSPTSLAAGSLG